MAPLRELARFQVPLQRHNLGCLKQGRSYLMDRGFPENDSVQRRRCATLPEKRQAEPAAPQFQCLLAGFSGDGPLDCGLNELARVLERQLLFDVGLIGFNGLYADMKFFGDLAGSMTFSN